MKSPVDLFSIAKKTFFNHTYKKELLWLLSLRAPMPLVWAHALGRMRLKELWQFGREAGPYRECLDALDTTSDWFSTNINHWLACFAAVGWNPDQRLDVLEIGSWEGMSTRFIAEHFGNATITCVDTWGGADELLVNPDQTKLSECEQRFDRNLAPFSARLHKCKMTSQAFFSAEPRKEAYDFVYVDGSHYVDDVMLDALCAFASLRVGGLLIFDDYQWNLYQNPIDAPAAAINAFLRLKAGQYRIVWVCWQVAIQKLATAEQHRVIA